MQPKLTILLQRTEHALQTVLTKKQFGWLVAGVAGLPFIFLCVTTALLARNVPILDQWEFALLLQKHHESGVSLADFFAQHNEHRLFFPRLIMFCLALLSHWNSTWEIWASVIIAGISFVFLADMLRKTLITRTARLLAIATASLIFFSPMQFENWLWGWQLEWFVSSLGLLVAIWALTVWKAAPHKQVLVAVACAFVATYSLGSGMFVWLACLVPLAILKPLRPWLWPWILLAACAIGTYYLNYQAPGDRPLLEFLHQPLAFAQYIMVYLAHPLAFHQALSYGVALFMALCVAGGVWFMGRPKTLAPFMPFICLAAFAGVTAVSTAMSRLTLGVDQAYSSRYTTIALLLTIALTAFLYKLLEHKPAVLKSYAQGFAALCLVVITLLTCVHFAKGTIQLIRHADYIKTVESCARHATAHDPCLTKLYPWPEVLWPRLEYMRSIHWAGQ